MGDDLVPEEVSSLLGCEPTHAERKGDRIPANAGERIARSGSWRLRATDKEPENLDSQVAEILGKLTQDLSAWRALTARFRIDLFCGWFMEKGNEGVSISPATLLALGERGIELGLDIYAPSADA